MDCALGTRLFTDADAAALTELLHAAYAPLGAQGLNYTAVDQDEKVTLQRARGGRCWVVTDGQQLVATLTMSMPPSRELQGLTAEGRVEARAWLNQMGVHPELQRSGVASHLWSLGRSWAGEVGARSVGVDTAAPAEHLVRLYSAWGFQRRDVMHWPGKTYDSVVMACPLLTSGQARS